MDLSKAFDTINHELFTAKLYTYGFNIESLESILNYLSNRQQTTKVCNNFSYWAELLQVVPEASALESLFKINYLFDLTEFIDVATCIWQWFKTFYGKSGT